MNVTIAVNRDLSNCENSNKKKVSTGVEPVASAFALQCSISWAMKTHILEAGQFIEFINPWKEWNTEWNDENCGNTNEMIMWPSQWKRVSRPPLVGHRFSRNFLWSYHKRQKKGKLVTTWMLWWAPSKFCNSLTQIFKEDVVKSSTHTEEASCFTPRLSCSTDTSTVGADLNFPCQRSRKKIKQVHATRVKGVFYLNTLKICLVFTMQLNCYKIIITL